MNKIPNYSSDSVREAFESIPHDVRLKILNSVWCRACLSAVGIAITSMECLGQDLVLRGTCVQCGGPVARVLEGLAPKKSVVEVDPTFSQILLDSEFFRLFRVNKNHKFKAKLDAIHALEVEHIGKFTPEDVYSFFTDRSEVAPFHRKVLDSGPRDAWEMEQFVPREDDSFDSPICDGVDLADSGRINEAISLMEELIEEEPRCIDAYAHIGNFMFRKGNYSAITTAKRYYKMGVAIGLKSIADRHSDVFPWFGLDNRPFLRALQGFGLCCYREGRLDDALTVFIKMLWLNPSDNQGVRFLVDDINRGLSWEEAASEDF